MPYFDSATLANIATGNLVPRTLVTIYFDEIIKGYWNEAGPITNSGISYTGDSALGEVTGIEGGTSLSMANVSVKLSSVDPGVAYDFLTLSWHMRRIVIEDWLFDQSMRTIYPTPLERYPALIGNAVVSQKSNDPASITLELVDLLSLTIVNSSSFRTDGDQRRRSATDDFFSSISQVSAPRDVYWAKRQPAFGNAVQRGMPIPKK